MTREIASWFLITLMIILFSSNLANAQEAQQVKTKGTIGFTGVYEPIGKPDPTPPESIARPAITEVDKPGGTLPQTNYLRHYLLIWLGVCLINAVFVFMEKIEKIRFKK